LSAGGCGWERPGFLLHKAADSAVFIKNDTSGTAGSLVKCEEICYIHVPDMECPACAVKKFDSDRRTGRVPRSFWILVENLNNETYMATFED
jgi:hypothetical protein